MRMRLGQKVRICNQYIPTCFGTYPGTLRRNGVLLEPSVYEIDRYRPADCDITGIITGYKRITTKHVFKIITHGSYEKDIGAPTKYECTRHVSSTTEAIYVVQTTLKKKYYVKREWIEEVRGV